MNRNLINLVIVGFCVWLSAGCATRNHAPVKVSAEEASSPFKDYDDAFIDAVEKKWDDMQDKQMFASTRTGKVDVYFHLNSNGTVSDMKILNNNVGEVLGYYSEEAIYEVAPFKPWPSDMKRMIGKDYRELTFTFNY